MDYVKLKEFCQDRLFSEYYPAKCGHLWYQKRIHAVKSLGFNSLNGGRYEYAIESPSSKCGIRRYLLEYSNPLKEMSEHVATTHFQGLIGESIMRIVMMEFFRRKSLDFAISNFEFLKWDKNPQTNKSPRFKSDNITGYENSITKEKGEFSLEHCSRYTLELFGADKNRPLAEFDGILEYSHTYNGFLQKGVLVCESKAGMINIFTGSDRNKDRLVKKLLSPLKELYSDCSIDYLLMGTPNEIYSLSNVANSVVSPLDSRIVDQFRFFAENDVGLIPFVFPDSRESILSAARSIASLRKMDIWAGNGNLERKMRNSNPKYGAIVENGVIYITKGERIEKILEPIGKSGYRTVFSI